MPQTMTVRVSQPSGPTLLTRIQQTLQVVRGIWTGPLSAKDPALARLFGSGYESAAGVVVTAENAFTFSAVFDAVNQLASDPSKLPLNLRKRRQGGGSDDYEDSRLYWLLKYEPNPEMSSMVFRRTLLAHALTCHGGYAEIERDTLRRPSALWILTPGRVEVHRERRGSTWGPLEYLIDGKTILQPRDVLHVSGLGYDGITGYSVIDKARQSIGLALAAERFGAQFFGKGTVFGGWLETDEDLDDDQIKGIKASLDQFRSAQDSAFRTLITGRGRKYHQFNANGGDTKLNESRVTQVLEVARFFRMPPHRLGVTTPGAMSYASVEAANLDYYTGPILDWCTLVEQEFNRKLISPLERRQQFIKHNVTAFLRGDTAARSAFYEKMLDRGVFNADDVLALEDMNPQPNGLGQLYLVQAAQIPKDRLADLADAQIEKTKQEATPEPAPVVPAPVPADETDALRDALTRADRAEAALIEVRTAHETAKSRVIDLTESEEATAAELTAAHEEVIRAGVERVRLEVVAEEARGTVAALQAAQTVDREAIASAQERIVLLERASAAAEQAQSLLQTERETWTAAVVEAQARVTQTTADLAAVSASRETDALAIRVAEEALARAQAEADGAQTALRETQEAIERTTVEIAVLRASVDTAQRETETTRVNAVKVEAARHVAEEALAAERTAREAVEARLSALEDERRAVDEAKTAADVAREVAEATLIAYQLESESTIASAQTDAEAARKTAEQATTDAESAREAALAATREAVEARQSATEARQQADALRTREAARAAAVVPAHRALIADALRRVTSREVAQARRAQATPEKLRKWIHGLDAYHEAICRDIVTPALRAHLAHLAGPDGTAQVEGKVDALIAAHLAQLRVEVDRVLDAPPEDFHAVLDRWVTRWETDRPEQVADALLGEEIDHGRRA